MKEDLPDSDTVVSVLLCIALQKNWSSTEIGQDCAILAKHRLVSVGDLRALSGESWTQIELLPLVKDLLRSSIDPHWPPRGRGDLMKHSIDQKKKKDKKKQAKKDKGPKSPSSLGTPVEPIILAKLSESSSNLDDSLNPDFLTIQNTILNGNIAKSSSSDISSTDGEDDDSDSGQDDTTSSNCSKSVSFSNKTAIGIAASENTEKKKGNKKGNKKEKKKMKTKHTSEKLPPAPINDEFLQGIRDKLEATV